MSVTSPVLESYRSLAPVHRDSILGGGVRSSAERVLYEMTQRGRGMCWSVFCLRTEYRTETVWRRMAFLVMVAKVECARVIQKFPLEIICHLF